MGKNKKAAYSKREEEKANRIVKGLFIGLIETQRKSTLTGQK